MDCDCFKCAYNLIGDYGEHGTCDCWDINDWDCEDQIIFDDIDDWENAYCGAENDDIEGVEWIEI